MWGDNITGGAPSFSSHTHENLQFSDLFLPDPLAGEREPFGYLYDYEGRLVQVMDLHIYLEELSLPPMQFHFYDSDIDASFDLDFSTGFDEDDVLPAWHWIQGSQFYIRMHNDESNTIPRTPTERMPTTALRNGNTTLNNFRASPSKGMSLEGLGSTSMWAFDAANRPYVAGAPGTIVNVLAATGSGGIGTGAAAQGRVRALLEDEGTFLQGSNPYLWVGAESGIGSLQRGMTFDVICLTGRFYNRYNLNIDEFIEYNVITTDTEGEGEDLPAVVDRINIAMVPRTEAPPDSFVLTFAPPGGDCPNPGSGTSTLQRVINPGVTDDTYAEVFDTNGALVNPAQPIPIREGYIFTGWWTEAVGGVKVISTDTFLSNEDHTLYAQWTPPVQGVPVQVSISSRPVVVHGPNRPEGTPPMQLVPGDTVRFELVVRALASNPVAAENITLSMMDFPDFLSFGPGSVMPPITPVPAPPLNGEVVFNIGTLNPGQQRIIMLTTTVTDSGSQGMLNLHYALNFDSALLPGTGSAARLSISSRPVVVHGPNRPEGTPPMQLAPGDTVRFELVVRAAASNTVDMDNIALYMIDFPGFLSFGPGSVMPPITPVPTPPLNGEVVFNIGTLSPGQQRIIMLTTTVDAPGSQGVLNLHYAFGFDFVSLP